jgi:hypothetical protein
VVPSFNVVLIERNYYMLIIKNHQMMERSIKKIQKKLDIARWWISTIASYNNELNDKALAIKQALEDIKKEVQEAELNIKEINHTAEITMSKHQKIDHDNYMGGIMSIDDW